MYRNNRMVMNRTKWYTTLALIAMVFVMVGCGSMNPRQQVNALKSYNYDVESVSNVRVGGRLANELFSGNDNSLGSLPSLAFAILQKDLPLEALVNMKVSNPTSQASNINAFKFLVEIQGKPFFEGTVDQRVNLQNGESTIVPLTFKANLFGVTEQGNGIERVLSDVFTREGNGAVILKIKPSINIGGKSFFYPGYITVDNDLMKSVGKLL